MPREEVRLRSGERVELPLQSRGSNVTNALLACALGDIDSRGSRHFRRSVTFPNVIGKTLCVETQPDDDIIYARRKNRPGYSRFVRNRRPEECRVVTVVLCDITASINGCAVDRWYTVEAAWVGENAPPEPWDNRLKNNPRRLRESQDYWSSHGFVWRTMPTVQGTETTRCPWPAMPAPEIVLGRSIHPSRR